MDKRARLKKMVGGKGGPGYSETATDSPFWSRYADKIGTMGKTFKARTKSARQRRMELLDISNEIGNRNEQREWDNNNWKSRDWRSGLKA